MSSLKEKIYGIKTIHEDIRVYLNAIKDINPVDIHYGLWKNKKEDFIKAQINLSEFIISKIPPYAKKILDVGGGVGGFSEILRTKGYEQVCIVPDKELIRYGKNEFPYVKFLRGSAETFSINKKSRFDGAVMIESFQYFTNRKGGIKNIIKHLNEASFIIIVDEFSLSDEIYLPGEERIIKLLNESGFCLKENSDLSHKVIRTCDFLTDYFKGKDPNMEINWKNKKKFYQEGKLKYKLLVFEKGSFIKISA